jgi:hypothetical protein
VIDLIEYHAEESQTVLPQFLGDGRGFDLAFIDGTTASRLCSWTWRTWDD